MNIFHSKYTVLVDIAKWVFKIFRIHDHIKFVPCVYASIPWEAWVRLMSKRKPYRRATVVHRNWLEERLSKPWINNNRDSGKKLRSGRLVCVLVELADLCCSNQK